MSSPSEDRLEGLSGLFSLIGVVPARARFMGEAVVSSTLSSITIGLVGGMMGVALLPTGPLIPLLVGSWVGNSFGLWYHYRSSKNQALQIARNYPTILAHAMFTEHGVVVPLQVVENSETKAANTSTTFLEQTKTTNSQEILTVTLDQWIQQKGSKMIGFAIMASQQCRPDVEEIHRLQRETLIEAQREKFQAKCG
jgi:hypothetical protein